MKLKTNKSLSLIIFSIILMFLPNIFYGNEISVGIRTGIGFSGNIVTPTASGVFDLSNNVADKSSGSTPVFSFNAGFMAGFLFKNSNFGFEVQVNYILEGSKIENELTAAKDSFKIQSLDIALPFKMSLFARILPSNDVHHPYLLIGPVFSIPLSAKLNDFKVKSSFNSLGFGLMLAFGGRLRLDNQNIFFIEVSSRFIFTDRLATRGKLGTYAIYFNIGYEFILTTEKWDR